MLGFIVHKHTLLGFPLYVPFAVATLLPGANHRPEMPVPVAWPAHFYQPCQWLAAGTWLTCPLRNVAHVPGSIIRFTTQMTPQRGPGQRRRRAPAASAARRRWRPGGSRRSRRRRRTPVPGWHQKPFGSCASCTACTEPAASCEPSAAQGRRRQTSRRNVWAGTPFSLGGALVSCSHVKAFAVCFIWPE